MRVQSSLIPCCQDTQVTLHPSICCGPQAGHCRLWGKFSLPVLREGDPWNLAADPFSPSLGCNPVLAQPLVPWKGKTPGRAFHFRASSTPVTSVAQSFSSCTMGGEGNYLLSLFCAKHWLYIPTDREVGIMVSPISQVRKLRAG